MQAILFRIFLAYVEIYVAKKDVLNFFCLFFIIFIFVFVSQLMRNSASYLCIDFFD